MIRPLLLGLLLTARAGDPAPGPADAPALVERLGAARFADRERAAQALRDLGGEALPALRLGGRARDPEVRTRSGLLAEQIESALMLRPTAVRLDFRDAPLDAAVAELSRRTGLRLTLHPSQRERLASRRVTAEAAEPLPAWEAVDRLCRGAGLLATPGDASEGGLEMRPTEALVLFDGRGAPPAPTCNVGPFRVKLLSSHYQRDRLFEPHPDDPGGAGRSEHCQLQLQVLAEPRLIASQVGPVRLEEARDENGLSLLPGGGTGGAEPPPDFFGVNNGPSLQASASLLRPESAGRTIRVLRGRLPLLLASRRSDPLDVPLASAVGRTFAGDRAGVTIHGLKSEPDEPQFTIELSVLPAEPSGEPGVDSAVFAPELLEQHLEILDAGGRPLILFPMEMAPRPGEFRLSLMLAPRDGVGRPERLRLYSLNRVEHDVRFEFRDVEMP